MLGKPNIRLPLASSYNERGTAGVTQTITNAIDQRKINCYYDIVKNSVSGATTLYLCTRPGVTVSQASTYSATTSFTPYLISRAPQVLSSTTYPWVFGHSGNACSTFACDGYGNSSIIFSSGSSVSDLNKIYHPFYVDHTLISNQDTIVLQTEVGINTTTVPQRVFFSSNAVSTFVEITNATFTSVIQRGKIEHMDGYAHFLDSNNFIYSSSTNSLTGWGPNDRIAKQIQQDVPIGLMKFKDKILAMGYETAEIFYNPGTQAVGSPLLPVKIQQEKIGLVHTNRISSGTGRGTHYYAISGNRLYFVGRRSGGGSSIGVFSFNGASFEKISSAAIDKLLADSTLGGELTSASHVCVYSFGFHGKAAIAIQLYAQVSTQWLMYFPDYNEWFEWNTIASGYFGPTNSGQYFILTHSTQQSPRNIFYFSGVNVFSDNGTNFSTQVQFKLPNDGGAKKHMSKYGVIADTSTTAQGLTVEFSDDDYQTWQTAGTIDMTVPEKTLSRGGSFYDRAVRLTSTTAAEVRLQAFEAWVK